MKPAWALDVASKGGAIARISRADSASVENGSMSCNSLHDGKPYSAHIESPDSRLRPPQYCTGSPETMAGFAPDPRRSFGLDGLSFGAGNVSSANSFPWPDLRWTACPQPRFACVMGAARAAMDKSRLLLVQLTAMHPAASFRRTQVSRHYDHKGWNSVRIQLK